MGMALKTKLIMALLIGSSSAAVAQPNVSARFSSNARFGASVTVRDHRPPNYGFSQTAPRMNEARTYGRLDYPMSSRLLAQDLHYERSQYRKDVVLGGEAGMFRGLTIQGERGSTYLMKVVIEFADGDVQQVPLDATLHNGEALSINLDGRFRAIHRILVYRADGGEALSMDQAHRGAFNVFAY